MKHYRRSTEAENTTKTKETQATKMKIKVTIKAGHCRHRNKPHPAKQSGERKYTNISRTRRGRKTNRNQLPENNNSRTLQRGKAIGNAT